MAFVSPNIHSGHKAEHYPIADDFVIEQAQEALRRVLASIKDLRRRGSIPATKSFDLDFMADVSDTMDEFYKVRLIQHQHKLLMKALANPEFATSRTGWLETKHAEWKDEDGRAQTMFTRVNRDLALVENVYFDQDSLIHNYIASLVTGKDVLNDFVKAYLPDSDVY